MLRPPRLLRPVASAPHRALRGMLGGVARTLHGAVSRLFYGDVLVLLRLDGAQAEREFLTQVPGLTMRFLTAGEVTALAGQGDTDLTLPYVADALARGDRCFAILDGDRLASYSWYALGPTGVTRELAIHFPRPHIYMHHSFTTEAYRGRRLHTIGIVHAIEALAAAGPVSLLAIVSTTNEASLKSCQRAGYRPLGRFFLAGAANRLGVWGGDATRLHGCTLVPRRDDFAFLALPALPR